MEYLEIVRWDAHLHPDVSRKVKPPYRWVKLETENLDSLGDLSLRDYGAFCRLLGLAALTNNRTVYNAAVIRRRTGVTKTELKRLQNRGLIRITEEKGAIEKSQQKQPPNSESASETQGESPQVASAEGMGIGKGSDSKEVDQTHYPASASTSHLNDRRSFDSLKTALLPVAQKLNTRDAHEIHKLAGQSLRMSTKQIQAGLTQLIEDGKL